MAIVMAWAWWALTGIAVSAAIALSPLVVMLVLLVIRAVRPPRQHMSSDGVIITEALAQGATVHISGGAGGGGGGFYDGSTHPARSDRAGGGPG